MKSTARINRIRWEQRQRMAASACTPLFALISVGTPVRFINVPVKVAWSGGTLLVEAHPAIATQGDDHAPTQGELADVLFAAARDTRVSILWERAREALERADGVIATVGTRLTQ